MNLYFDIILFIKMFKYSNRDIRETNIYQLFTLKSH